MTKYIPILSSPAGMCLTGDNWQAVKVDIVSYELFSLLIKPGYDFLMSVPNLADYLGCFHQQIVLNASSLKANKEGCYKLVSPYDGTSVNYNLGEILALISHLRPQFVLLPQAIQPIHLVELPLPTSIFPFFSLPDSPLFTMDKPYGVYYNALSLSPEMVAQQLTDYKHLPMYVMGNTSPVLLQVLRDIGVEYFESDKAAQDACKGVMYHPDGHFKIQSAEQRVKFDLIDDNCQCPICQQQFTRAYLHHLYEHTPLLCQRFLIMHNQFQPFT